MVEEKDACDAAIMAALDLMNEKCEERGGEAVLLNEDTAVFIPEEAVEEIGYSLHSPETPEEREQAIKSCMRSKWARGIAEKFTGPSPPREFLKKVKRKVCEGLYD